MKNEKKAVTIRFDSEKWDAFKKKAEDEGMSAAALVRKLVYDFLKKKK